MESCIRGCADLNQLKRCKEEVESLEPSIIELSEILNLAGNTVRLKILYLIFKEDKLCPCDLSDILNMTVPAISQHLKKMWNGGLVDKEKVGQTIYYSLNSQKTNQLRPFFEQINESELI